MSFNKRRIKLTLASLLCMAFSLSACATFMKKPFPTPEQIQAGDHGQYPENYKQIVKEYLDKYLRDPDSARVKPLRKPTKALLWIQDRWIAYNMFKYLSKKEGQPDAIALYGYKMCLTFNGKNKYGAYVGYKTHGLFIRNGKVLWAPKGSYGPMFCQRKFGQKK